jgi:hypothetical protein
MSHFCCFSASVGATVGSTDRTVDAGSDVAPRCPMNGSCSAVTGGTFPAASVTATRPVMYGCTLHTNRYTPAESNSAEATPPLRESSWSTDNREAVGLDSSVAVCRVFVRCPATKSTRPPTGTTVTGDPVRSLRNQFPGSSVSWKVSRAASDVEPASVRSAARRWWACMPSA